MRIPMAAPYKVWFSCHSLAGIAGSNHSGAWISLVNVTSCQVEVATFGWSSSIGVLQSVVVKPGYWGNPGPLGVVAPYWGGGQINCSFFSYYFFPPLSNQASFNYEIFGVSLYCTFSTASTVKSLLPAGWRQCTSVLRTSSSGLVPRYRKKRCVSKFVTRAHHTCVEPYRASCTSSTSVESPRSASSLIWWKVLNEPEILRFNFVKNNRI